MSNYYSYEIEWLMPFENMKIISKVPEKDFEKRYNEIIKKHETLLIENNLVFEHDSIHNYYLDLNQLMNPLKFNDRYFISLYKAVSSLVEVAYNINIELNIKPLNEIKREGEHFSDCCQQLQFYSELISHIKKIDTSETHNHLDKYLFNIDIQNELYPTNKLIKLKFENWVTNFKKTSEYRFINQLIDSEKRFEKAIEFNMKHHYWKSKIENMRKAIEKLEFFLSTSKNLNETNNSIDITINSQIKTNKKIKVTENFSDFFGFMSNIDSVMKKYTDIINRENYTQEEVEDLLSELRSLNESNNIESKKIIKLRYLDTYNLLNQIIKHDTPYHKYWIIHEIMQALALEKTTLIGLTPTIEGFTNNIYKTFSEINKLRVQELQRKFK